MLTFGVLHRSAPSCLGPLMAVRSFRGRRSLHSTGAPIVFWCHLLSDRPSVAVLFQLLVRRPGMPCHKMLLPPAQNVAFQKVFFRTSSSDTDCILTFSLVNFETVLPFKDYDMIWYRDEVSDDAMCTLVHAFITSRVDYCNAVLYGIPAKVTRPKVTRWLQAVLHAAARLITGVFAEISISPRHCVTRYIGSRCILFKSRPDGVWLWLWSRTRILWWCPCASSYCWSLCLTAICRSQWHGRPAFMYCAFWSVPLLLVCTICVERPTTLTEEQWL